MKKYITWIMLITTIIFIIDWGIMGLKLLDGNYNIFLESYIGAVCFIIVFACILYKSFSNKCSHCDKIILINGQYCSYCGKKL